MKLIENWKDCWKMASFQIAVVLIILEFVQVMMNGLPTEPTGYVNAALLLVLPLARLLQQNIAKGS